MAPLDQPPGSTTSADTAQNDRLQATPPQQAQKVASNYDSPGDFLFQKGVETVLWAGGVAAGAAYAAWEGTAQQREQVNQAIREGLEKTGQYSQERMKEIQNFLSEKSLEGKQPGRPTPENTGGEFQPPTKGATTGKVEGGPLAGKEGWLDKDGNIWVPTNGRAPHGGEHYDVQDKKGRNHENIYPGGHRRSDIDGVENVAPAVASLQREVEPKTRELLRENGIAASDDQVRNLSAKVVEDMRTAGVKDVGNLQLTEGSQGKFLVATAAGAGEFSPRAATLIEAGMNTPAAQSLTAASRIETQDAQVIAQAPPSQRMS